MKSLIKDGNKLENSSQANIVNGDSQNVQQGNVNVQMIYNAPPATDSEKKETEGKGTLGRILASVAAIATIISCIWLFVDENRTITNISISTMKLEMKVGEKAQLVVRAICSDNSEADNVMWISSNPSVVDVDQNGRLVAITAGEAEITAQATVDKDTKNVSCSVKVLAPPSGYAISLDTYSVCLFEKFNVVVTPYGEDITEIWLYAKAPSGHIDDFQMDITGEGRYLVDTEKGIWEIYAVVKNKAGIYEPSKPEDIVYIEVK